MKVLSRVSQLFQTLKHLKFEQFYYRALYRFKKPNVAADYAGAVSVKPWRWQGMAIFEQSLWDDGSVVFLNEKASIHTGELWNSESYAKLWLYNLHYFDDLNAFNYYERQAVHYAFIDKWIAENPPCGGNGWEPYPISLRLVNWVKWFSRQSQVKPQYLASICLQAQALTQQLEYHILGNHLFANAKALTFVGCYLQCKDAEKFLDIGVKLLDREIDEQFLVDGAHFELSPMYHVILLWDLLDLIQLAKVSNNAQLLSRLDNWKTVASNALTWLNTLLHPDGEISFFNDAAMGIAAKPHQVFSYAEQLGLSWQQKLPLLTTYRQSGYSRIEQADYSVLFDHANVGPDFLPGHAHADTLSFEMSVGEQRLFVNSGTSLYGVSKERLRQRKTAAHNTVVVANSNSSEVWSGFRVARRAYAKLIEASTSENRAIIAASHDGYTRLKPKINHKRTLVSEPDCLVITDDLSAAVNADFHLHLHPDVAVVEILANEIVLQLPAGQRVKFSSSGVINVVDSTWHPQFGVSVNNKKFIISFTSTSLKSTIQILKD